MIFTFLFIAGCQQEELLLLENEENGNVKEQTDKIKKTSLSYETWSQQLDYLVNECPEVDFITNQGLHLDEYKLLEHKIGNEVLLRESSFMPFYSSPESPNDFNIMPLIEIKSLVPDLRNKYEKDIKKSLLDNYSEFELKNVQLTWRYEDKKFTTVCFVTDKEVIYDDILSNIRRIVVLDPESVVTVNVPRLKSADNYEDGGMDGSISYSGETPKLFIHSWSGETVACSYCVYKVFGKRIGGVEYIESADCYPYAWAITGNGGVDYYADAGIKITSLFSGKEGEGYVSFAYGSVVSSFYYASIFWDDFHSQYYISCLFPQYINSIISDVSVTPSMLN